MVASTGEPFAHSSAIQLFTALLNLASRCVNPVISSPTTLQDNMDVLGDAGGLKIDYARLESSIGYS